MPCPLDYAPMEPPAGIEPALSDYGFLFRGQDRYGGVVSPERIELSPTG